MHSTRLRFHSDEAKLIKHNVHFCYSESGETLPHKLHPLFESWEDNLKAEVLAFTEPSTQFYKYSLTRIMDKLQSSSDRVGNSFI